MLRALQAGARAYLLKTLVDTELLATIRSVHSGKKALSSEASYQLAEHATDDALTPAEVDVLRLIAAGNANKQIADRLSVTEDTIKGRVKNTFEARCQRPHARRRSSGSNAASSAN